MASGEQAPEGHSGNGPEVRASARGQARFCVAAVSTALVAPARDAPEGPSLCQSPGGLNADRECPGSLLPEALVRSTVEPAGTLGSSLSVPSRPYLLQEPPVRSPGVTFPGRLRAAWAAPELQSGSALL